MSLIAYLYECANCGNKFIAPEAEGYGMFILRSQGQSANAKMNGFEDRTYMEVADLLGNFASYKLKNEAQRAEILQKIFSIACDKDQDGTEFVIGAMPKCPRCGSRTMAAWDAELPVHEHKDPIPDVTHEAWEKLPDEEKKALLKERLVKVLGEGESGAGSTRECGGA